MENYAGETIMLYQPEIRDWELFFERNDGRDNRLTVIKAFIDFFHNSDISELKMPGRCMLGGEVYGHSKFDYGDEIITSSLKFIKRLKIGKNNFNMPHDLFCATTKSDNKYYFYSDSHSAYMSLMFNDIAYKGKLDEGIGHYLKPEYRRSNLLL